MKDIKDKCPGREYLEPQISVIQVKNSAAICGSVTTQNLVEEDGKFEWI